MRVLQECIQYIIIWYKREILPIDVDKSVPFSATRYYYRRKAASFPFRTNVKQIINDRNRKREEKERETKIRCSNLYYNSSTPKFVLVELSMRGLYIAQTPGKLQMIKVVYGISNNRQPSVQKLAMNEMRNTQVSSLSLIFLKWSRFCRSENSLIPSRIRIHFRRICSDSFIRMRFRFVSFDESRLWCMYVWKHFVGFLNYVMTLCAAAVAGCRPLQYAFISNSTQKIQIFLT